MLVVADEKGEFGEYAYRTWNPRPIVGTQGRSQLHGTELMNNGVQRKCKIDLGEKAGDG